MSRADAWIPHSSFLILDSSLLISNSINKMKNKSASVVWQLLRRNISKWQIVGYSAANIVGLSVVVIGVLFFSDSRHSVDEGDAYISNDYVVLSKKVEGVGFTPSVFSEEEIADIKNKPWTGKVGKFTSSQFAANASVNMGGAAWLRICFLSRCLMSFLT